MMKHVSRARCAFAEGAGNEEPRDHEPQPEPEESRRRHRRAPKIGNIALVPVERTVDGERPAVQRHHPQHQAEQHRADPVARGRPGESERQQRAEQRMARHDRPFGRAEMQQVVETGTQQPVAQRTRGTARSVHQRRPTWRAASLRPCSVRSSSTISTEVQSGATMTDSPPVATTRGVDPFPVPPPSSLRLPAIPPAAGGSSHPLSRRGRGRRPGCVPRWCGRSRAPVDAVRLR